MSSDNFDLIRKWGGRYYLTGHSASSEYIDPLPVSGYRVQVFPTLDEAMAASMQHYTEYGTQFVDLDGGGLVMNLKYEALVIGADEPFPLVNKNWDGDVGEVFK